MIRHWKVEAKADEGRNLSSLRLPQREPKYRPAETAIIALGTFWVDLWHLQTEVACAVVEHVRCPDGWVQGNAVELGAGDIQIAVPWGAE
jgi:hypothetical protein